MTDINEARILAAYCGIYCGSCGMYRGRIYAGIAGELLEIMKVANYPEELTINPEADKPDFDFGEFMKGLAYFSKNYSGAYCQESCKDGGGVPCEIRLCARERGLEICYECHEYPCTHFPLPWVNSPEKMKDYELFRQLGFDGWVQYHAERAAKGYANATRKYYTQARKED